MKVYAPPEGFDAPSFDDSIVDGRYDRELDDRLHHEYLERLAAEARRRNQGSLVGEVIRFPVADGYAAYMIWSESPFEAIHLPIHDAWQIPEAHARGLRLSDARDMVERDRRIAELFASKGAS